MVGPAAYARALALQPDGRIVVVGSAESGGAHHAALWRYLADGTPDRTFGGNGIVVTRFGTGSSAYAVAY